MSDTPMWTPGPWHHHGPGSVRVCDGGHDLEAGCWTIAEAEIIGVERETAEANARLIAAAPELYEALDWLCAYAEESTKPGEAYLQMARAALAKARGTSQD